ncbi:hypothetical protein [Aureimonas ureilytica]|nr:hypothetical protein [Aureimonas ureilytica]
MVLLMIESPFLGELMHRNVTFTSESNFKLSILYLGFIAPAMLFFAVFPPVKEYFTSMFKVQIDTFGAIILAAVYAYIILFCAAMWFGPFKELWTLWNPVGRFFGVMHVLLPVAMLIEFATRWLRKYIYRKSR